MTIVKSLGGKTSQLSGSKYLQKQIVHKVEGQNLTRNMYTRIFQFYYKLELTISSKSICKTVTMLKNALVYLNTEVSKGQPGHKV